VLLGPSAVVSGQMGEVVPKRVPIGHYLTGASR